MATVPMDLAKVARCRVLAAEIADDVQRYIDGHTTVGVERTILRAYGADGLDDQGVPLVNTAVDRYREAGLLGRGIAFFLGRALLDGAGSVQDAAERLAFASQVDGGTGGAGIDQVGAALRIHTAAALTRIDRAKDQREAMKSRIPPGPTPLKYVIVATGNIYDDAVQAKAAAHAGADIVAVIRATAQSLLDYVPHGATTEGYGGTFATQENFAIIRRALDEASESHGRYVDADELLVGALHGGDRLDGGRRAARHAPQRRDVRDPLPRHQHVPHLRRPVRVAALHRARPASSSTRARTTT